MYSSALSADELLLLLHKSILCVSWPLFISLYEQVGLAALRQDITARSFCTTAQEEANLHQSLTIAGIYYQQGSCGLWPHHLHLARWRLQTYDNTHSMTTATPTTTPDINNYYGPYGYY